MGKEAISNWKLQNFYEVRDEISLKELMNKTNSSLSTVKALENKGDNKDYLIKKYIELPLKRDIDLIKNMS